MDHTAKHAFTIFRIFACLVLLLAWSCTPGRRKPDQDRKIITAATTHGETHSFNQALDIFGDELKKLTNGRIVLRIYHSSQLGGEKELQEMLTPGSLDMTVSGVVNTYEPLFALFEMPYLYRDRNHVLEVFSSGIIKEVAGSLEKNGIHLAGIYENGFRNITNSVRPVEHPADLQGMLIRTPENPAQIETIISFGAIPTPMSFSELYNALIQGVVDGQENPLQNIWYGRLYESQKYLAMTRHIYNAAYILVSRKTWENISPEDQAIFTKCIDRSTQWQLRHMQNLDRELEEKIRDYGVEITYPDRQEFAEVSKTAYTALYHKFGAEAKEIVRKIRSAGQ